MRDVQITITQAITEELVDDILVAAFEGGINYWCEKITYDVLNVPDDAEYASEIVSKGGTIYLHHEDGKSDLDLDKFVNGIKLYCEANGCLPNAVHEDHDANDADQIVQYAIFGEVVFA